MKRLIILTTSAIALILLVSPFWFSNDNSSVAVAQAAVPAPASFPQAGPATPARLIIPSIALNDPIIDVGLNSAGDMDVPSGKTQNIGWYAPGTVPGQTGSAVLDAHVFAAFKNLHDVELGTDIYVLTDSGSALHFKVTEVDVYPLSQVPADRLFNANDGKHLNLITCAGTYIPSQGTYDHRLVVYATLVN